MINNLDFAKRLKEVMEYYQLSATAFAQKINVQRSSISHLLSGRNRPSLDFVLKVLDTFPEVELYWLLNGRGSFPKETKEVLNTISSKNNTFPNSQQATSTKEIDRIIIFFKDGTFKPYKN